MGRFSASTAALGIAVLAVVGLSATPAAASCLAPVPLDQALAEASHVFVGTVAELRFDDRFAVFDVEEVWKGDLPERVEVNGGPSPAELGAAAAEGLGVGTSLDRTYRLGGRYLVVSHGLDGGVLADNACTATREYNNDLVGFRPADAHAPNPARAEIPSPSDRDDSVGTEKTSADRSAATWWVGAATALIIAGGVAATVLWRQAQKGTNT